MIRPDNPADWTTAMPRNLRTTAGASLAEATPTLTPILGQAVTGCAPARRTASRTRRETSRPERELTMKVVPRGEDAGFRTVVAGTPCPPIRLTGLGIAETVPGHPSIANDAQPNPIATTTPCLR